MPRTVPTIRLLASAALLACPYGAADASAPPSRSSGPAPPRPVSFETHRWSGYLGSAPARVSAAIERAAMITGPSLQRLREREPLGPPRPGSGPGVTDEPTPIAGAEGSIPTRLWLGPVTPNPSDGGWMLRYDLPRPSIVAFHVHDVAGRVVHDARESLPAGRHVFALDAAATRLAPGAYFVRMTVDGHAFATRRVVVRF